MNPMTEYERGYLAGLLRASRLTDLEVQQATKPGLTPLPANEALLNARSRILSEVEFRLTRDFDK
jgi:hypothetical protein